MKKMRILVTGSAGFIGRDLLLGLNEDIEFIPYIERLTNDCSFLFSNKVNK